MKKGWKGDYCGRATWRNIDWSNVKCLPETGRASWAELSEDFSALEKRQVSAIPTLLGFRVRSGESGPEASRNYSRTELKSLVASRQDSTDLGASPLENSALIVSVVAPGAGDVATTPLGTNQPKVLVHATALNDLIQKSSIQRVSPLIQAGMLPVLLPHSGVARLFRSSTFLLLFWIAGCTAILLAGFGLLMTTHHLIGSVFLTGVWTILFLSEFVRSNCNQSYEEDPPPKPPEPPNPPPPNDAPLQLVYSASFGTIQALPRDGRAITSWNNRDEAWATVAREIRRVVDEMLTPRRARKLPSPDQF